MPTPTSDNPYHLAFRFIELHIELIEKRVADNMNFMIGRVLSSAEKTADYLWTSILRHELEAELISFTKDKQIEVSIYGNEEHQPIEKAIISGLTCILAHWRYHKGFSKPQFAAIIAALRKQHVANENGQ